MKINIQKLVENLRETPKKVKAFLKVVSTLSKFFVLLFFTFIKYIVTLVEAKRMSKVKNHIQKIKMFSFTNMYNNLYQKLLKVLDNNGEKQVKNSDLILLALNNLASKKSRTYVTIGGMAVGFGAVILLLSLGYGFERLVIGRIATLNQMKQIDVNTSQASPIQINIETLNKIKSLAGVETLIPSITSVSKVTYNNAVSDVIVNAVPSKYFEQSEVKLIKGEYFEDSSELTQEPVKEVGLVAGAKTSIISKDSYKKQIGQLDYSIFPQVWKPIYSSPKTSSKILGYTKREGVKKDATELWGGVYKNNSGNQAFDNQGNEYSRWIYDSFRAWEAVKCDVSKEYGCIDGKYMPLKTVDETETVSGYITEDKVEAKRYTVKLNITNSESLTGANIKEMTFKFENKPEVVLLFDLENESLKSVLNPNSDKYFNGTLVYGPSYSDDQNYLYKAENGKEYGYWIRISSTLWTDSQCKGVCNTYSMFELEKTKEISTTFFVKLSEVVKFEKETPAVLGSSDSNLIDLEEIIKEDKTIDWASISSDLGNTEKVEKNILKLPENAKKVAVVNQAMLNILGLDSDKALGEEFSASIIFDSKLFDKVNYLAESEAHKFKIIGVTSDTSAPTVFVPLGDVKVEGLKNVSMVKVIVKDQLQLQEVRSQIESFGFQTSSVVDTVDRIGDLFSNIRIGLFILGLIALGVASLGMFNTLTVSLMEKTREVGLLKTMGMKSAEIKILFLAESVSMSVLGGVSGLIFAYLLGKLISLMLSGLAISQGQSALDITYIPTVLVLSILLLSGIVGIFTGWYPSRRATEVSALNALRYE